MVSGPGVYAAALNDKLSFPAALKWLVAIVAAEWMHVPSVMRALVILMAIDYVSGFVAAIKLGVVSSQTGWWGLVRKVMTVLLLMACHLVERELGAEWKIEQIAAFGYCVNEAVSVVENCSVIGVPIPARLVASLASAQRLWGRPTTAAQLTSMLKLRDRMVTAEQLAALAKATKPARANAPDRAAKRDVPRTRAKSTPQG